MIKGYHIIRELHRGPITTAYLAVQTALDRRVLLKILNEQWKNEKDLIARFEREAKICARLQHPNIVTLYDFGVENDLFYLTMEYVEGPTLEAFIAEHHPLPIPIVEIIAEHIARGLSYAHREGVIHRDIKPANILISPQGIVKIADFGLATIKSFPSVTMQGAAVGTPAYMAPELIERKPATPASDVFSFGVTVYQMLTSQSPFEGEHLADTIQRVLHNEPPPVQQLRPDVPEYLSTLVQHMLAKNPQKRPSDGQAVLTLLQQSKPTYPDTLLAEYCKSPETFTWTTTTEPAPSQRRRPWYLWGIPLGGILLLWMLFRLIFPGDSSPPQSGPVTLPDTTEARVDTGYSTTDTLSGSAIAEATPAENASSPDVSGRTASSPNSPRAAAPRKPAKSAPAATGFLWLESFPWAEIVVDGTPVDTTPLNRPLELTAGPHQIVLRNPDFLPVTRTVTITAHTSDTLRVQLQPREGYLRIYVSPWGKIYVNGNFVDTTPLNKPIALPPGEYVVRVENPNFSGWEDTIRILPGQTVEKRIQLTK